MPIKKKPELYYMLKRVMRDPIVILVKGDWRSGKTNNALLIAFLCLKWGIVDKAATNIKTRGTNALTCIESTGDLKQWMHGDHNEKHREKIYILDEALKTIYRRKAMSKLSVKIITEIMPEVSKGHCRLLVLTQIDSLDTDVLHPAFHRATWTCTKKGEMETRSKHYPYRVFEGLPKSPIDFDPDLLANFFDKEKSKVGNSENRSEILQICELYAKGKTINAIAREYGLHKQQVKRHLQKGLKWFSDNYDDEEAPQDKKIVNSEEVPHLIE